MSGITWSPLGQASGWQWPGFAQTPGNPAPLAEQRSYTSAGQLAASALLQLTWDSAGRIAQITQQHMLPAAGSTTVAQQVPLTSAYSYDTVGRLTASAHSAPGTLTLPSAAALSDTIGANASGYAWDANGNRSQSYYSSSTAGGTATLQRDYQIASDSNRLGGYTQTFTPAGASAQTTSITYHHDATGSITRKGDSYLHYGVDGRIAKAGPSADPASALAVSYTYNALGQRVFKSDARLSGSNNPAVTQQTVYAEDGIGSTVLGQYGSRRSGNSAAATGEMDSTEVIYLPTAAGPMPVAAQINGRLYAIDADHLNTPRRLTNTQGQVAWQWLITGFGEANPTTGATNYSQSGQGSANYAEPIRFDLRYPGQVFDEETQLNYNLNRYYDQTSGRYIQADPIGLDGGWNRFGYVAGNPLNAIDPQGLNAVLIANRAAAWVQGAYYRYGPAITEFIAGASGVNGAVVSPMSPLVAQIPTSISRMTPVARAVSESLESAGVCAANNSKKLIDVFRAVVPAELNSIQKNGIFTNLSGFEGKYFTTSAQAASSYARQAVRGFGDPAYTIVQSKVPQSVLNQPGISATVDRGIPAFVIPNGNLPGLIPNILSYSPLP
ncbi:RHS repeat-associated core domain-containing protein [Acidovorax sp. SUPP3334]|uniref:RHS repeat-associated core domain-containing protein n=1 Tax=Acidovorax sp. SUPP3334 TaxID=2920881 RepID=UPI0023DE65F3|nr:RHS repeat-associated core domain-containing protein [Acidovorax sp. SUPP3334]GKT26118.1 hypothetical protein AVHM3334_20120 [Acidovorax sp. SUPP3334]